MKFCIFLLLIISFCSVGQDEMVFINSTPPSIHGYKFLKATNATEEFLIKSYLQKDLYKCGNYYRQYSPTADEWLKFNYVNGNVKTFDFAFESESYTPIRQLIVAPDKAPNINNFYLINVSNLGQP